MISGNDEKLNIQNGEKKHEQERIDANFTGGTSECRTHGTSACKFLTKATVATEQTGDNHEAVTLV